MATQQEVWNNNSDILRISNILNQNLNNIENLKNACRARRLFDTLPEEEQVKYDEYYNKLCGIHNTLNTAYKKTINASVINVRTQADDKYLNQVNDEQMKLIKESKKISIELLQAYKPCAEEEHKNNVIVLDENSTVDDLANLNNKIDMKLINLPIDDLKTAVTNLNNVKFDEYDNTIIKYLQLEGISSSVEGEALSVVKGNDEVTYKKDGSKHIKAINNALFVHKLFNLQKIYTDTTKAANEIEEYQLSISKNVQPWKNANDKYPTPEKVNALFDDIKKSEDEMKTRVTVEKQKSDDANKEIKSLNNDWKIYNELVEELKFLINSHTNGNKSKFLKLAQEKVTDAAANMNSATMKDELAKLWDSVKKTGLLSNVAVVNDSLIQSIDGKNNASLLLWQAELTRQNTVLNDAQAEIKKLTQDGSWQEVTFEGNDDKGHLKVISMYLQNKAVLNDKGDFKKLETVVMAAKDQDLDANFLSATKLNSIKTNSIANVHGDTDSVGTINVDGGGIVVMNVDGISAQVKQGGKLLSENQNNLLYSDINSGKVVTNNTSGTGIGKTLMGVMSAPQAGVHLGADVSATKTIADEYLASGDIKVETVDFTNKLDEAEKDAIKTLVDLEKERSREVLELKPIIQEASVETSVTESFDVAGIACDDTVPVAGADIDSERKKYLKAINDLNAAVIAEDEKQKKNPGGESSVKDTLARVNLIKDAALSVTHLQRELLKNITDKKAQNDVDTQSNTAAVNVNDVNVNNFFSQPIITSTVFLAKWTPEYMSKTNHNVPIENMVLKYIKDNEADILKLIDNQKFGEGSNNINTQKGAFKQFVSDITKGAGLLSIKKTQADFTKPNEKRFFEWIDSMVITDCMSRFSPIAHVGGGIGNKEGEDYFSYGNRIHYKKRDHELLTEEAKQKLALQASHFIAGDEPQFTGYKNFQDVDNFKDGKDAEYGSKLSNVTRFLIGSDQAKFNAGHPILKTLDSVISAMEDNKERLKSENNKLTALEDDIKKYNDLYDKVGDVLRVLTRETVHLADQAMIGIGDALGEKRILAAASGAIDASQPTVGNAQTFIHSILAKYRSLEKMYHDAADQLKIKELEDEIKSLVKLVKIDEWDKLFREVKQGSVGENIILHTGPDGDGNAMNPVFCTLQAQPGNADQFDIVYNDGKLSTTVGTYDSVAKSPAITNPQGPLTAGHNKAINNNQGQTYEEFAKFLNIIKKYDGHIEVQSATGQKTMDAIVAELKKIQNNENIKPDNDILNVEYSNAHKRADGGNVNVNKKITFRNDPNVKYEIEIPMQFGAMRHSEGSKRRNTDRLTKDSKFIGDAGYSMKEIEIFVSEISNLKIVKKQNANDVYKSLFDALNVLDTTIAKYDLLNSYPGNQMFASEIMKEANKKNCEPALFETRYSAEYNDMRKRLNKELYKKLANKIVKDKTRILDIIREEYGGALKISPGSDGGIENIAKVWQLFNYTEPQPKSTLFVGLNVASQQETFEASNMFFTGSMHRDEYAIHNELYRKIMYEGHCFGVKPNNEGFDSEKLKILLTKDGEGSVSVFKITSEVSSKQNGPLGGVLTQKLINAYNVFVDLYDKVSAPLDQRFYQIIKVMNPNYPEQPLNLQHPFPNVKYLAQGLRIFNEAINKAYDADELVNEYLGDNYNKLKEVMSSNPTNFDLTFNKLFTTQSGHKIPTDIDARKLLQDRLKKTLEESIKEVRLQKIADKVKKTLKTKPDVLMYTQFANNFQDQNPITQELKDVWNKLTKEEKFFIKSASLNHTYAELNKSFYEALTKDTWKKTAEQVEKLLNGYYDTQSFIDNYKKTCTPKDSELQSLERQIDVLFQKAEDMQQGYIQSKLTIINSNQSQDKNSRKPVMNLDDFPEVYDTKQSQQFNTALTNDFINGKIMSNVISTTGIAGVTSMHIQNVYLDPEKLSPEDITQSFGRAFRDGNSRGIGKLKIKSQGITATPGDKLYQDYENRIGTLTNTYIQSQ